MYRLMTSKYLALKQISTKQGPLPIRLSSASQADFPRLEKLRLPEAQQKFTLPVQRCTEDAFFPILHLIWLEQTLVGYFMLDPNFAQTYDFCPPQSIVLRGLAIDQNYQGGGIGRRSMQLVGRYTSNLFPGAHKLYLTVNCQNGAARNCYLKAGWTDTNQIYHAGSIGPQHIMSIALS